ncbi:hypothetical protein HNP84_008588 [Thermocatellispora tengchongensis]|uniref:Uncharacterized protein n=1 Tax=Thermocatellispora tengchongensis TaxID=1073253 RepID=A0A840PME1_9ACTN|nr:hypothetical protein [Thermocatellispora tengchongensis]MBB5138830.1 hypothetical protein [Thermocatellispora tengchongensis]
MSGSSGLAAPPRPPAPAQRVPSPYALPLYTLRLLARCGVALVAWFAAGQVVRFALLYLGTEISHGDYRQARLVATMLVFTLVVAANLVVTTGMLYSIRGALAEMRARRAENEGDERFLVALDRVAPAFAVIYLTWGLHVQDARDFVALDQLHNIDAAVTYAFDGIEYDIGRGLSDLNFTISLIIMFVAWVVRIIFERRYESGNGRFSGAFAAFAELSFAFFGLTATFELIEERSDWLGHRSVVAASGEMMTQAEEKIPGWSAFWGGLGEIRPYVIDALALPLMWLAVAILVYGADVNDTRAAIRGMRLDRAEARYDQAHSLTRTAVARLTMSVQERWIPILHALRLTVRGGAPLFGMFCLSYAGIQIGMAYADRALRHLIGSDRPYIWLVFDHPVSLAIQLVSTLLTMCLLGATFDIAATRARLLNPPAPNEGTEDRPAVSA